MINGKKKNADELNFTVNSIQLTMRAFTYVRARVHVLLNRMTNSIS